MRVLAITVIGVVTANSNMVGTEGMRSGTTVGGKGFSDGESKTLSRSFS